jgi:hypothetical protein
MTIVSYSQDELAAWTPEREARLKLLAEMPDSEIKFTDEAPKLTEEQLSRFRPFHEVTAERKQQRAAKKEQTVGVG